MARFEPSGLHCSVKPEFEGEEQVILNTFLLTPTFKAYLRIGFFVAETLRYLR